MHLLRYHHVPGVDASEPQTKAFQRPFLHSLLKEVVQPEHVIGDIGAHSYFHFLMQTPARTKAIIDPYNGAGGAGLNAVPALPFPIALFRCGIGLNSEIIPDRFFDVTFSCSVIEHIGQAETQYDCAPLPEPHPVQDSIRDTFCEELFRITKPGGLTIHTVDHAARNLSFYNNFTKAGFVYAAVSSVLADEPKATVDDALWGVDVVRQRGHWLNTANVFPPEVQSLHGTVVMTFQRPF